MMTTSENESVIKGSMKAFREIYTSTPGPAALNLNLLSMIPQLDRPDPRALHPFLTPDWYQDATINSRDGLINHVVHFSLQSWANFNLSRRFKALILMLVKMIEGPVPGKSGGPVTRGLPTDTQIMMPAIKDYWGPLHVSIDGGISSLYVAVRASRKKSTVYISELKLIAFVSLDKLDVASSYQLLSALDLGLGLSGWVRDLRRCDVRQGTVVTESWTWAFRYVLPSPGDIIILHPLRQPSGAPGSSCTDVTRLEQQRRTVFQIFSKLKVEIVYTGSKRLRIIKTTVLEVPQGMDNKTLAVLVAIMNGFRPRQWPIVVSAVMVALREFRSR